MSRLRKIFLIMCLVSATQTGLAAPTSEMVLVERSQLMMKKLIEFSKQKKAELGRTGYDNNWGTRLVIDTERLLSQEKNPAVLARVALIVFMHTNMSRETSTKSDEILVDVFTEAWVGCMTNIGKLGRQDALLALENIEKTLAQQLDGGHAHAFHRAREIVKTGMAAKRTK